MGDRSRLEQVFANLIDNALQAMGQDGVLTLGCSFLPASENQPARVHIAISDTGPGIAPELKERIFKPFYTTKKGGTGLGLPIARRIMNAHNGTLDLESYPGVGTMFIMTIPAVTK